MSFVIEDVLVRDDPVGGRLPIVLDSPHSGRRYPPHFAYSCPTALLRQAEDSFVDDLFRAAPEYGATYLRALFPRTYIDVNRAIDDIDPAILDGPWPARTRPTDKSAYGMGLIRTHCKPGVPIYDGKLSVADVTDRIERCYLPYHWQLESVIDRLAKDFGTVWHINCHSMPSSRYHPRTSGGQPLADFVLGDRDGTTCERVFVSYVKYVLEGLGYRVAVNTPYRGVELVRRYGNPARGRHSLQLEVNRDLYMDEENLCKHDGFDTLRRHVNHLIQELCAFAQDRLGRVAAE